MLSQISPSPGKLLISEPFLMDPNFKRSVVLLTEHGEGGTMGFVLNQPSSLLLRDVIPELGDASFPVFIGGPVGLNTIHFIHRCHDRINDGEEIGKGVYWGGDFEALKVLIAEGEIALDEIKFFIGYSGWGGGQLMDEVESNTWIISDQYYPDLLFSADEEELWKEVIINLGPRYAHVSKFPSNPNLN